MFDLQKFSDIAPEWSARLRHHRELASTNDEALRLCAEGVANLTVLLADHQLAGRGRRGAAWLSESGAGLLFSLIVRSSYDKKFWGRLALVTGLSIATVLREQWQLEAEVKWPNDIIIEDKKCCGILVETQQDYAVIGVGINVTGAPAGDDSVALRNLTPYRGSREELLSALLDQLLIEVNACVYDFDSQLRRLHEICYLTGKEITFRSAEEEYSGTMQGISPEGELMVLINGETQSFLQADTIRAV